jgi:predicted GNAT family acetyltransferase
MADRETRHANLEVRDSTERSRFELLDSNSVIGYADYHLTGDGTAVMPHTVINPNRRGEGLGEVLVGAAVQELRARGLEIDPICWFVADYLHDHPDVS